MHISELDSASPYPELLSTGKAVMGKIHIINGRTCITHMIPLFDKKGEILGAFGVIIFRGMEKLKNLVRTNVFDDQSMNLFNQLSRAEASNSFDDFLKRALGAEEVKTPETINAAYRFATIRDVVNVANYMGGSAFIPNLLYKDLANDGYILYLPSLEEGDPKEVARFCGLLSEFAAPDLSLKQIPAHAAGFECIIPENALAHLAEV